MNDLLSPTPKSDYDASSIQVLEDMEHVRLRPGMYIGGKDDRALHHMVAEIIDNSMDEAVAGHATWIEVELHANGHVSVRDNGRGIPVDPHPKDPRKSALEIIFCMLNAGGKFSGDSYQTSGGLHGVGSSVVNALSDHLRVEVARNRELYMMEFSRGIPQAPLAKIGAAPNRRGTSVTFHPDPEIFGSLTLKPARLFKMARSKAYLFSGVEIRWKTEISDGDTPAEATFKFPGGLADYLGEALGGATTYAERPFAGSVDFRDKYNVPGKVEWAINWTPARDGFIQSYCNTVPTPEGGTHEAGFWAAILKGIKAYGDLANNRKATQITREDLLAGGCALVSCFIREPEFVGQTKDRLATTDAARMVEGGCATISTTGWRRIQNPRAPSSISSFCAPRNACAAVRKRKPNARPRPRNCACPASWWIARQTPATAQSCSSSRATLRAALPRWRATARPRRSCRSEARFSTCWARPRPSWAAIRRSTI